jgi:NADH-ubiquinone oxidoreductase chain 5
MTAPTPVSSLVHSSTLVTAGVYLMIRFNLFLFNDLFFNFVSFVGLVTIGLGGLLAILEIDFKKIIAFSTLRQLGLLVFILRFGEIKICFFHLLSHAIFKSFLFMLCGIFMSLRYGSQDGRIIGNKFLGRVLFQVIILFSCLNLSGFPLTMGFLSKDLLLETFIQGAINCFFIFLFVIFCCFTVCYSLKLFVSIIFYIKSGFSVFNRQFFLGGKI